MKMKYLFLFAAIFFVLAATSATAQDKTAQASLNSSSLQSYDLSREQTLVGTVLAYSASSPTPPLGPRLMLQTSSGVVDVHLGNSRTLASNHFLIQPGDTLRMIGENVSFADKIQFLARILQKGTQAITLRSTHGFPIPPTPDPAAAYASKQGGAL